MAKASFCLTLQALLGVNSLELVSFVKYLFVPIMYLTAIRCQNVREAKKQTDKCTHARTHARTHTYR